MQDLELQSPTDNHKLQLEFDKLYVFSLKHFCLIASLIYLHFPS